jgi:hypothetical protein
MDQEKKQHASQPDSRREPDADLREVYRRLASRWHEWARNSTGRELDS